MFVEKRLSILIVDENGDRAALIEQGLRDLGHFTNPNLTAFGSRRTG